MKKIFLNKLPLLIIVCGIILTGCKTEQTEDDPKPSVGSVKINFENEVDGTPLNLGVMNYTSPEGNQYSVDMLKYYISNVTFIKTNGEEYNIHNYDLINEAQPSTCNVSGTNIPNGYYSTIRFSIGVDSMQNHTGAQEGDLDPAYGMIWTWSTGYIFFKHEGQYKDAGGTDHPLIFHLGKDKAYKTVEIPVNGLLVFGNNKTVNLRFNLNNAYSSPHNIDFDVDNNHQSMSASDNAWIDQMKDNLADAFSLVSIE